METNYQMNYYDYGINLEIPGVMPVIGGGGVNPEPDTHEYVNLGLPSGTLWATENIKDADGNELYFAWGETQGYTSGQVGTDKNFSWEDYKYGTYDNSDTENYGMTKYNKTDGKTVLDPEDDAATVNWGSDWKMPTEEQFEELIANTDYEWSEVNGVQGAKFTSKVEGYTDKFLFFPAVGDAEDGDVGESGFCWFVSSRDLGVGYAWHLMLQEGSCETAGTYRNFGFSVRPVRVEN